MRQFPRITSLLLVLVFVVGASAESARSLYKKGQDLEARQDYINAFEAYNEAYNQKPTDLKYRIAYQRTRFLAAAAHVNKGQVLRESGNLAEAMNEFVYAAKIDPSSVIATQEIRRTKALLDAATGAPSGTPPPATPVSPITKRLEEAAGPIDLAPISNQPLTLEISNDSKNVYETIGKLAGVNVLFDPEYVPRRVTLKLNGVSLQESLDILAFHSGSFWRPVTPNTIYVAANTPAKRKELEQNVLKTFYLSNISTPTDMQDIVTALRTVLDLQKLSQVNSQNAIIIRDTPDKIAMAEKLIGDLDKGKPEVIVDIAIMQVRRDKLRNLGVTPPASATVQLTGPTTSTTTTTGTTTTGATVTPTTNSNNLTLNTFQALKATDFAVSIPAATANFLFTDNNSKLLQNPQIRASDGVKASLKIGDRVPIATGSIGNPLGGVLNSTAGLVNTQFQYLDVGVNIDITPRVYPDREIGLKLSLDVSSVTGTSNIGGISQPIISQRKIEHDIRLKDGEVNLVGGIFEQTDSNSVAGLPWLAQLPFFKYFFSSENKERIDNEIVFILIPHVIRAQEITALNNKAIDIGTANYLDLRRVSQPTGTASPAPQTPAPQSAPVQPPAATQPQTAPAGNSPVGGTAMFFDPAVASPATGSTFSVNVSLRSAADLFSAPVQISYDPSILQFVSIANGDILSKDGQAVALVHREDAGSVQASATRPPGSGGISGDGTLFTLTFQAKKPGQAVIGVRPMFRNGTMQVIPVPPAALTVTVH